MLGLKPALRDIAIHLGSMPLAQIKIYTPTIEATALCASNGRRIPIATRPEALAVLVHRVYQHHAARGEGPYGEYSVSVQRLHAFGQCAIDKPALFVKVAGETVYEALLEYNGSSLLEVGSL